MQKILSGPQIRQSFIDFFVERGHKFVPSSSLVPGGDQTLLFTNAGMVQFKDVFLGTDRREYKRAANSQKCMRVAGKHNDLDDVGRDDTHHTFFEMLGNWSFGDYYKKEAINWAWELLTVVWGLDPSKLYVTCFKDEKGEIETDIEAADTWREQPGINTIHIQYFGRKENFWEMADTGPCGPCSEIHIDMGEAACNRKGESGHICAVNGNCSRYVELWNLVFIQYNRINQDRLEPLTAKHVDTGMGLDRIVSVLQGVSSNYRTDLLFPIIESIRAITGDSESQRDQNFTPYRVITDHCRAATFLIADGVTPGNIGRNYICRMIIRRAFLFGGKLGIKVPFLYKVSGKVIELYGDFYPELKKHQSTILNHIKKEEERFISTVENGLVQLNELIELTQKRSTNIIDGKAAFELYATHGLPVEIAKDIAYEHGLMVDEKGFAAAMDEHRIKSGAGNVFKDDSLETIDLYQKLFSDLVAKGLLPISGVEANPYSKLEIVGRIIAMIKDGKPVETGNPGDQVEIIVPKTCFYLESGGQVSDTGWIESLDSPNWKIQINNTRKPSAGLIIHIGIVLEGNPKVEDFAIIKVDGRRRKDIMRNHTASHLLHRELQMVLGDHARQAGSLVTPDKLRFDFSNPGSLTTQELEKIQDNVNQLIQDDYELSIRNMLLNDALSEGATALFGEKYGENVRTVQIGNEKILSYELCGGTHVDHTSEIGMFLITSEGSVAAGIRRIEAVTGRGAYELIKNKFEILKDVSALLESNEQDLSDKIQTIIDEKYHMRNQIQQLRLRIAFSQFEQAVESFDRSADVPVLSKSIQFSDNATLREMTDYFKQKVHTGVVILGSIFENKPIIVAAITDDLVGKGLNAGKIVKEISTYIDGNGGGRSDFAQAGGKNPEGLSMALSSAINIISQMIDKS
jgi:alanyl-tRNA synthetase